MRRDSYQLINLDNIINIEETPVYTVYIEQIPKKSLDKIVQRSFDNYKWTR